MDKPSTKLASCLTIAGLLGGLWFLGEKILGWIL